MRIGDELHLVRNAAGDPTEVVGSWSDITARKQIGEALVAAQDRTRHLLSAAPAVIYSYKATGDFAPTFISRNIKDLFDYDPQEYLKARLGAAACTLMMSPQSRRARPSLLQEGRP